LVAGLSACGGTKFLKEPLPLEQQGSLVVGSNESVEVALDWVTVRGGPGTWAKNADWDEYKIRVANLGESPITLNQVQVFDSLGFAADPNDRRKALVKSSKKTVKRYRKVADLDVKAGANAGVMVTGGVVLLAAGSAAAYASAGGAMLGGTGAAAGAGAVAMGAVLAAPVLVVGGIVMAVNNKKVDEEIGLRSTELPLIVKPGTVAELTLFYPLAPSPEKLRLSYLANGVESQFELQCAAELMGLHIESDDNAERELTAQHSDD
jgi:hypothetical protein